MGVTRKELAKRLGINENQAKYWSQLLIKEELIEPQDTGIRYIYSEEDVKQFETLQEYLQSGARTVAEGVRLMIDDVSPEEALRRYKMSQRQLEVTQSKLLALRKPFWERVKGWLGTAASKLMFWRND